MLALYFVDVILPIALDRQFTYCITKEEYYFLKPGMRVAVPFGKRKIYTAIVHHTHQNEPTAYEAKQIYQILEDRPSISAKQLAFWEWIATYYMCTLGEVVKAAMPSVFLLESETIVLPNTNFEELKTLNSTELLLQQELLKQSQLTLDQVIAVLNKSNVFPVLKSMMQKNALCLKEEIYEQYQPKMVVYIRLTSLWEQKEKLQELMAYLSRSEKQRALVMHYFTLQAQTQKPIQKKILLQTASVSAAVCKNLEQKGVFETYQIQTDRIVFNGKTLPIPSLTKLQQEALTAIKTSFSKKAVCLFYGVTGSGKTEIYSHLIDETLKKEQQVLFLVPEIALTTQLIIRLQKLFGEHLSVYHSKYSQNERAEVWNNLLTNSKKARIILGTRSATLLPYVNLGLIIVDEEHETSYKQLDPAPRYHARDAAIVLANQHKANCLLGTGTPSIESFYNAQQQKYGYVSLKRRFGNVQLPKMELVNIKEKHQKKQMTGHFSDTLLNAMQETLSNKEQVILFQNRRGYAPLVTCETCGVSPQCPNCDVSLTEHKFSRELRCHYCGYKRAIPKQCDACGSTKLDSKGFGTEQIEQELLAIFPNHNIGRLDYDTTRGKYSYQKIIEAFQHQEIDVLVGTQMLSKGLDFKHVRLVGVLNADNMLNFPDFRAQERSFQMLTQVAGRAGRNLQQGLVLLQTFNPYHQILQQVTTNSYEQMYQEQLTDRKHFCYPPFYRIIQITLKHKNFNLVNEGASWVGKSLKNTFGKHLLGPSAPSVSRVRNQYIQQLIVKIPPMQSVSATKAHLGKVCNMLASIGKFRAIRVNIDVDAY